jgi:outer membrane receptor protein involved in Fe transport
MTRTALAALILACAAAPADAARVTGTVSDPGGRPIAVAIVALSADGQEVKSPTDSEGRFTADWNGADEVRVTVEADGYAPRRRTVFLGEHRAGLALTLWPVAFAEELTITAARRATAAGDSPASVAVLTGAELRATAAPTFDDALRQVPGFSLFRRQGSRYANPTTLGATLRGIGGSGASRALVLDDGVPLNDPFGGWVYWSRVPRADVEQVEVVRGGASALYGSGALAGVVQFVRADGRERRLDVEGSAGTQKTVQGSLFGQAAQENIGIRVALELLRTGGYVAMDPAVRGRVDDRVRSDHMTEEVTVDYAWDGGTRLFARGGMYGDTRHNGTPFQRNQVEVKQGAIGLDHPVAAGRFAVRVFGTDQFYEQVFTLVEPDRNREHLSSEQAVPATSFGAGLQWARGFGGGRWLVLGADRLRVSGRSEEESFLGRPFERVDGRQVVAGVYGDHTWSLGARGTLSLGARYDRWTNGEASRLVGTQQAPIPGRRETAVSPRAALLFRLASRLAVTASAYRAFRAPTLNELYRPFRVGSILTQANESLEAERVEGREAGLVFTGGAFSLRATAFDMRVDDPVANVTVAAAPDLITRQRRNLGGTRTEGVEVDAEVRAGRFALSGAFLRAHARVRSSPADRTLEGKRLPQVPRDQAAVQARYGTPGGFTLGLQGRWTSRQFDDDRNLLPLRSMRVLDAFVTVPLGETVSFFVAGENVTNERYEVGRTPLTTFGPPRQLRAGLRVRALRPPPARP